MPRLTWTSGIATATWRKRLASRSISRGPRRCHNRAGLGVGRAELSFRQTPTLTTKARCLSYRVRWTGLSPQLAAASRSQAPTGQLVGAFHCLSLAFVVSIGQHHHIVLAAVLVVELFKFDVHPEVLKHMLE